MHFQVPGDGETPLLHLVAHSYHPFSLPFVKRGILDRGACRELSGWTSATLCSASTTEAGVRVGLNVDKQEAQETIRDAGPTEIQGTCRTQFTCASHFPKDRKDGFLDFDDAGRYGTAPLYTW